MQSAPSHICKEEGVTLPADQPRGSESTPGCGPDVRKSRFWDTGVGKSGVGAVASLPSLLCFTLRRPPRGSRRPRRPRERRGEAASPSASPSSCPSRRRRPGGVRGVVGGRLPAGLRQRPQSLRGGEGVFSAAATTFVVAEYMASEAGRGWKRSR